MIFDLSFSGNPVQVSDAAGGDAAIILHAQEDQRGTLLTPRSGSAPGEQSLYLDGWSTWVTHRSPAEDHIGIQLAAWFAPRAIAGGDDRGFTALIDATHGTDGVALGHMHTGHIAGVVAGKLIIGALRLERERWHHMVITVTAGQVRLLLDGVEATSATYPHATVSLPDEILIGRTAHAAPLEGLFVRGAANGLIARASAELLESSSSADETIDSACPRRALDPDTAPRRSRYDHDIHRPIAHLSAPQGWMNEPHAAIQIDGQHHVFAQHNPTGPYWGTIAWTHSVSDDMVHWHDAPIALAPADTTVAPDGIWSGSSVRGDAGEHLLYFTAGDMSQSPDQSVAVARPGAYGWRADPEPVVRMPKEVPGRSETLIAGQFRDPFVWREGADWFMLVGAGLTNVGGVALLFHSEDGSRWKQQEPMKIGDVGLFPATGVMWELPVFLPVGTGPDGRLRHALFIAPWWAGPNEHHLQHVWHWIGVWSPETRRFTPDHAEPREFDGGGHLTGPSGNTLSDGRSILWTIAQDKRSLQELEVSGWAHNAGIPLHLGLHADGTLSVKPISELESLRGPRLQAGPETTLTRGRHLDIELEVTGSGFELELLRTPDGSEGTVLGVTGSEVWIDRTRSSRAAQHTEARRSIARIDRDTIHARVVVDGSMIEFYVDDRVSITSRAYPTSSDALGVHLRLNANSRLDSLAVYPLTSAYLNDSERRDALG